MLTRTRRAEFPLQARRRESIHERPEFSLARLFFNFAVAMVHVALEISTAETESSKEDFPVLVVSVAQPRVFEEELPETCGRRRPELW